PLALLSFGNGAKQAANRKHAQRQVSHENPGIGRYWHRVRQRPLRGQQSVDPDTYEKNDSANERHGGEPDCRRKHERQQAYEDKAEHDAQRYFNYHDTFLSVDLFATRLSALMCLTDGSGASRLGLGIALSSKAPLSPA